MPKRPRAPQRQTTASNTYRFFVDPGAIQGRDLLIEAGELAHQIGTVLRLRPGERVVLLDNSGWQYIAALTSVERARVAGTIERKELSGVAAAGCLRSSTAASTLPLACRDGAAVSALAAPDASRSR